MDSWPVKGFEDLFRPPAPEVPQYPITTWHSLNPGGEVQSSVPAGKPPESRASETSTGGRVPASVPAVSVPMQLAVQTGASTVSTSADGAVPAPDGVMPLVAQASVPLANPDTAK